MKRFRHRQAERRLRQRQGEDIPVPRPSGFQDPSLEIHELPKLERHTIEEPDPQRLVVEALHFIARQTLGEPA